MAVPAVAAAAAAVPRWVWWAIGGTILVILILVLVYLQGRKSVKTQINPGKPQDLPNSGSGIPVGWSPSPAAKALHSAMAGAGTDEDAIWYTLEPLTLDQRVAVYNEFNRLFFSEYSTDLFGWFEGDLSSSELTRAMGYFAGMGAITSATN